MPEASRWRCRSARSLHARRHEGKSGEPCRRSRRPFRCSVSSSCSGSIDSGPGGGSGGVQEVHDLPLRRAQRKKPRRSCPEWHSRTSRRRLPRLRLLAGHLRGAGRRADLDTRKDRLVHCGPCVGHSWYEDGVFGRERRSGPGRHHRLPANPHRTISREIAYLEPSTTPGFAHAASAATRPEAVGAGRQIRRQQSVGTCSGRDGICIAWLGERIARGLVAIEPNDRVQRETAA